jgi:hypothetical protein
MNIATSAVAPIREDVLRDPRYPVHRIADRLLPYLRVLVEQFHPEQVILFGSYAYGEPDEHSDVDLLVVKPIEQSPVKDATAIRRSWRSIRWSGNSLPVDILIEDEPGHRRRLAKGGAFYSQIVSQGLRLA